MSLNLVGRALCPLFWRMRGVFCSGAPSAQGSVRLSGQSVGFYASEPFRPSFLPAFLNGAWSLLLRSSLGHGFCPLIGPMRGALCSGTLSAMFLSAYRADAWIFLLRRPIGQAFCSPCYPMRRVLCAGAPSAKVPVSFSDQCVEFFPRGRSDKLFARFSD